MTTNIPAGQCAECVTPMHCASFGHTNCAYRAAPTPPVDAVPGERVPVAIDLAYKIVQASHVIREARRIIWRWCENYGKSGCDPKWLPPAGIVEFMENAAEWVARNPTLQDIALATPTAPQAVGEPVAVVMNRVYAGETRKVASLHQRGIDLPIGTQLYAAPVAPRAGEGLRAALQRIADGNVMSGQLAKALGGDTAPRGGWSHLDTVIAYQKIAREALAATAPAATAEPSEDPYFGVQDEVALTRAVCVMNDVLTDIEGWEDKALAEAVESSKVDLCAMIECIRMRADDSYVPGTKPIDGEFATPKAAEPSAVAGAREPLTEGQIIEIRDATLPSQGEAFDCVEFARAIERAHGIASTAGDGVAK